MNAIAKLLKRPQKIIGDKNVTMVTCPEFDDPILFAVTQDIKVGDKVISWTSGTIDEGTLKSLNYAPGFHKGSVQIRRENGVLYNPMRHVVGKVLSELSPNAIWVKDGDKIDIEIVRLCSNCEYDIDDHSINGCQGCRDSGTITMAKVKCSQCNTYH